MHDEISETSPIRIKDALRGLAVDEAERGRIDRVFNANDTLRVYPLENVFRPGLGDTILRRTKLWNALGNLWLEAETWDYEGGRFERNLNPVCPIDQAGDLELSTPLPAHHLGTAEARRVYRRQAHHQLERRLSELARPNPGRRHPQNFFSVQTSRPGETEIFVEAKQLFQLGSLGFGGPELCVRPQALAKNQVLSEELAGQPGQFRYIVRRRTAREGGTVGWSLEELYTSQALGQVIRWISPARLDAAAGRAPFAYWPLETIQTLLLEEGDWIHWHYSVAKAYCDQRTFVRSVQSSGDYHKIRDYLGRDLSVRWADRVHAGAKGDPYAFIMAAALRPDRNLTITRRIDISHARTLHRRLFFKGGLMLGLLIKNCWACGWIDRDPKPKSITCPFEPLVPAHTHT
jgi:hypothetical protein